MAFEPVIGGKSCIIADQSGSGKTLAYLLPIVQRLREEELQGISKSMSNSPRVVVLVPTAELASQVCLNLTAAFPIYITLRSISSVLHTVGLYACLNSNFVLLNSP